MRSNLNSEINWTKCNQLIPAIIQDSSSFEVLMLGYMNPEALTLSLEKEEVYFWSRTKNRIWKKGETSGNCLKIIEIKLDCDSDSLLIQVEPSGPVCHKNTITCFGDTTHFLSQLEELIHDRKINFNDQSYISNLFQKGILKVAQKVGEEATEVVIASLAEPKNNLISEAADLFFHLLLLLEAKDIKFNEILKVLRTRNLKESLKKNQLKR